MLNLNFIFILFYIKSFFIKLLFIIYLLICYLYLGLMYVDGKGVKQDFLKAKEYYELTIKFGD